MAAIKVTCERYDHQGGLDWPAMHGQRFSGSHDGDFVSVSDCGHVQMSEGWLGSRDAGESLERAEDLLAVLTAAVASARDAAALWAAEVRS